MPILHKATGTTGAVALTVTPDWAFELNGSQRVHLNAVGASGDLTVGLDAMQEGPPMIPYCLRRT